MLQNTTQLQTKSRIETIKKLDNKVQTHQSKQEFDHAIELAKKAMEAFEANEEWEEFMVAAYELAMLYKITLRFPDMIQSIDYTLQIYQEKYAFDSFWKVYFLYEKGSGLHYDDQITEAIPYYIEVCQLMLKEKREEDLLISSLMDLLMSYMTLDKKKEAQQALNTASELLNKGKQYSNAIIGDYYLYKAEWELNLCKYELARQSFEKAYEAFPSNIHHKKSLAHLRAGMMYGLLGNREKELAHYLTIANKYKPPKNKFDAIQLSRTYRYIGHCLMNMGDISQALYYFENALGILNQTSENQSLIAFNLLESIAMAYTKEGNYSKAIEYHKKGLDIGKKTLGEKNTRIAGVYRRLANAHKGLKDMNTALVYLQKGLRMSKDVLGENHTDTLNSYYLIGAFWTAKKNHSKGLKYLYKALNGFRINYGDFLTQVPRIYNEIGKNLYQQGELVSALKHFQLALITALPDYQETNFYHLPNIKQCFLKDSHLFFQILEGKALALFDYFQSLEQSESSEAIKALKASLDTCQFAADYIEELQKTLKSEGSKLFFAKRTPSLYELSIKITLLLSNRLDEDLILTQAFTFQERAKTLLLRSSMQENEAKLQAAIDPELQKQEKIFKNQIEIYLQQIQKEEAKGAKKDKKALGEWKQKHFDVLQSHQRLIERFEEDYPQYYQLKYDFHTVSVSDLQADLSENTVVVSYFIGPEMGYIFVVTPYDYEVVSLNLPKNFDQQIEAYLASIHAQNFGEFSRQSYALYCLLIQPIEDLIFDPFESELQQLVILPSGVLHYLPFETLIRTPPKSNSPTFHQLEYLLKKYNIQYHYSATLYRQYLQEGKKENKLLPPIPNAETPDFIGFAPIYTSDKAATQEILRGLAEDYSRWVTRSDALRDGRLVPLPYSEKEVQNIEALFTKKGLKGQSFLYNTATKNHFKSLATKAKYLHIAAHGLTNDEYPKLSGIVFHPTEKTTEIHDSILSMGEMYQLQLEADLVVLSSCESGIGTLAKGEGMMAMNRGFLYAGAKNVIYTLFKVLDKPSSELCEALFEEILEGKSYSEALRLAKLRLIGREDVDPKSWSGFVLLGA
ncbi:MAG: CHAT domain-containing protein [Chitinophagales bacterium]